MYVSIFVSLFTYSLSLSLSSSLSIYLFISLLVFLYLFLYLLFELFLSIFLFKPKSNCLFFSPFRYLWLCTTIIFHPSLSFSQHIYISFPQSYSPLSLISPAACIAALLLYYSLYFLLPNIDLLSSVGGCFF